MSKRTNDDELVFLPLGGSNEIGMNFNLYGFGPPTPAKWIVVDLGVTFGDQTTPGVEVILPDPTFIEEHADDILGIVLTHAHEDHIGAVAWLWPRLQGAALRHALHRLPAAREAARGGPAGRAQITEVPLGGTIKLGPFELDLITLTHSIPEPNGLAIRTPLGTVLHTGDWKIDADPLIGAATDIGAIRRLGDEGVLAMVCDSTNVFVDGPGRLRGRRARGADPADRQPEGQGGGGLLRLQRRAHGHHHPRRRGQRPAGLPGRPLDAPDVVGRQVGGPDGGPGALPRRSRGQEDFPPTRSSTSAPAARARARAALSRIADGTHPHVNLGAGDACVFSSRIIPGNEIPIRNLQNKLADRGVRLYTERDHPGIHVSGHPCRDELAEMYHWARPQIAVPTHGERRHLLEHAAFARDLQVPQQVTPRNGDMVRLAPGRAEIIDEVPAGRLYVDGGMVTVENGDALRERRHAASNGVVAVSVVLDGKNKIVSGPQVRAMGLPSEPDYALDDILDDLADEAEQALDRLKGQDRELDETVEAAMSRAVKKASQRIWGRRPVVETTVLRLRRAWEWSRIPPHHSLLTALSGVAFRQGAYADQKPIHLCPAADLVRAGRAGRWQTARPCWNAIAAGEGQAVTVSGLNGALGGSSRLRDWTRRPCRGWARHSARRRATGSTARATASGSSSRRSSPTSTLKALEAPGLADCSEEWSAANS